MLKSVKSRLTVLFLGLMAGLVLLFCGSLYLWIRRTLDRQLDQELLLQTRLFQEHFLSVQDKSGPELASALETGLTPTGSCASVVRADGRVLYATKGYPFPADRKHFRVRIDGVDYRGRVSRIQTSQGEVAIAVAVSEAGMQGQLREVLLYFAIFVPVMFLLSWLAGLLFVGRALQPLERIRRQAEQISRSSLAERVPEPEVGTEFKRLARTFNEMLERLERAFEDLQSFAADAAHELRTPLANLRAELETALQTPQPVPDPVLLSLAEEIERMSRIVTDLLTLAKLDLRQYALRREQVALAPVVREVCEIWQPVAAERRIALAVRECADASVEGDPVALRRVLMNLVENAIKYNRDEGRVDLSLRAANGTATLEVADGGPGIPAEHLPHLFRRFYRVDKARSRETGGAGLGLAICKSFVEAHEGKIEVASEAGKGTTFTVTLPQGR